MDEDEEQAPARPRPLYAGVQGAGLGLVVGAVEAVVLAATGAAPLSAADRVLLGVVAAGADAVAGLALTGLLALITGGSAAGVARALAITAGLLAGLYLWPGAATLLAEDRAVAAAGFALLPALAAVVVFFNARFWVARADRGEARIPWIAVAVVLAVAGIGASVAVGALRDTSARLEEGPSVVLVTVPGLRADAPELGPLAADGIRFDAAITPATDPRPATASLLTGVHPLRLRVLDEDDRLARGWRTVAEGMRDAGLATAAFVPDDAVGAAAGLAEGFAVFDDRYRPAWSRARLASFAASPRTRAASGTAAAFEAWLAEHGERPFFAWVHLQDAAAIPTIVAALRGRATIVVTAPHGELGGAHGGAGHRTLYDEVVHVPLVVRTPERPLVPVVSAQVRLMDVAPTLLVAAGLEPMDEGEGVPLLDYGSGLRKASMWTTIVGRDLDGRPLLGLRNNGVKYVVHRDGREELYDTVTDPREERELSSEQPAVLEQARQLLAPDLAAFERMKR